MDDTTLRGNAAVMVRPLLTAGNIVDWARRVLPKSQAGALKRWLDGEDAETIARTMSVGPSDVERLLRAALQGVYLRFGVLP
jgi:hypothetical protein